MHLLEKDQQWLFVFPWAGGKNVFKNVDPLLILNSDNLLLTGKLSEMTVR